MRWDELAQRLSRRTGLSIRICEAILVEGFGEVADGLARGEDVALPGFGVFSLEAGSAGKKNKLRFTPDEALRETLAKGYTRVSETQVIRAGAKRSKKTPTRRGRPAPAGAGAGALAEDEESQKITRKIDPIEQHASEAETERHPAEKPPAQAADRDGEDTRELAGIQAPVEAERADRTPPPAQAAAEADNALSSFAQDILGLREEDVARGLGLSGKGKRIAPGRRLTFPVQVSPQAKETSSRRWRPLDGEERRSFKELVLKNFFLNLGSIVREKESHEPLIVFDVQDQPGPGGETYRIRLLKVAGTQPEDKEASGTDASARTHNFSFEEVPFDWNRHEVLMVIDEKVGPRVHSFSIGGFRTNDRRDRAEVCLAQEYERYLAERRN